MLRLIGLTDEEEHRLQIKKKQNLLKRMCNNKNCRYCPLIEHTGFIKSSSTNKVFRAKHTVTCQSHKIIYCITCKICNIQYVGLTKKRLMDRFRGHFYKILTNDKKNLVGRHFNLPKHHGYKDMKITILSFITAPGETKQAKIMSRNFEVQWIYKLNTLIPQGLNIEDWKAFKFSRRKR